MKSDVIVLEIADQDCPRLQADCEGGGSLFYPRAVFERSVNSSSHTTRYNARSECKCASNTIRRLSGVRSQISSRIRDLEHDSMLPNSVRSLRINHLANAFARPEGSSTWCCYLGRSLAFCPALQQAQLLASVFTAFRYVQVPFLLVPVRSYPPSRRFPAA